MSMVEIKTILNFWVRRSERMLHINDSDVDGDQ